MMQTTKLDCDVLVAGGGPAGVPCALAAARNGARVILCQDRPVLGGNASSEVRMHIVGADASGGRGVALQTEAREGGIIEEIRLETTVHNPQRSASMLDLVLYDLCRREPNLTLLLNTAVVGAETEGGRITKAVAERQSTEDRFEINARIFIDCTGDGRLGAEAGAPFRHGRESKDEYGESLAQDVADDKTLGSTLLFQARNMGRPTPFVAPAWARVFDEEDLQFRPHATGGVDRGLEYGYWWVEWGGQLDTIKDNEAIRDELLAIMLGVWDHIKNRGDHGADNWALDWFGFVPGKRESRRFVGQYVLKEDDLLHSIPFHDAIAFGGWPIDTHPPEGIDDPTQRPATQTRLPHLFDIPLRACVSATVPNLMFAGRNISATHIAFASTRVMATCAAVGQGVGTAAAMAAKANVTPAELAGNRPFMQRIQQQLLRDDAYLIGVNNSDEDDLARRAQITASSEQSDAPASMIISGQTRASFGEGGAPADRTTSSVHRWMSDPAEGLPAWIELQWSEPIRPAEIRIVFDTGLHRPLTLTHSDDYAAKMHWGVPQPETVRDYVIEGYVEVSGDGRQPDGGNGDHRHDGYATRDDSNSGQWVTLHNVTGNYQRLRVHQLDDAPTVTGLRLRIMATQGINHARVCEVRVYE